jgi:hypothetical protein
MQQQRSHTYEDVPRLACGNYVRAPDGRVGRVVGFYKRAEESVVVKFASGASAEYSTAEIELL